MLSNTSAFRLVACCARMSLPWPHGPSMQHASSAFPRRPCALSVCHQLACPPANQWCTPCLAQLHQAQELTVACAWAGGQHLAVFLQQDSHGGQLGQPQQHGPLQAPVGLQPCKPATSHALCSCTRLGSPSPCHGSALQHVDPVVESCSTWTLRVPDHPLLIGPACLDRIPSMRTGQQTTRGQKCPQLPP